MSSKGFVHLLETPHDLTKRDLCWRATQGQNNCSAAGQLGMNILTPLPAAARTHTHCPSWGKNPLRVYILLFGGDCNLLLGFIPACEALTTPHPKSFAFFFLVLINLCFY